MVKKCLRYILNIKKKKIFVYVCNNEASIRRIIRLAFDIAIVDLKSTTKKLWMMTNVIAGPYGLRSCENTIPGHRSKRTFVSTVSSLVSTKRL